tara:strand:+ start:393 stop:530 length:138 start_codon:yes stop_codon:yes gene_type:complete
MRSSNSSRAFLKDNQKDWFDEFISVPKIFKNIYPDFLDISDHEIT